MKLYHGSKNKFSSFDLKYAFISMKSLVQEGPGFYFTTDILDAKTYCRPDGWLYICDVNPRKLVPTSGKPKLNDVKFLLSHSPHLSEALEDFDENKTVAMRMVVTAYTDNVENPHDSFTMIWNDIYKTDTIPYLNAMIELGYDGVMMPRTSNIKHFIIFNPNVITILETQKCGIK